MAFEKEHESLCWCCENARGGCSWSKNFEPVQGWNAKPTKVCIRKKTLKSGKKKRYYTDSFDVYDCPEFELWQYIEENLGKPDFDTEEIKIALEKYQGLLKEREGKNAEN